MLMYGREVWLWSVRERNELLTTEICRACIIVIEKTKLQYENTHIFGKTGNFSLCYLPHDNKSVVAL